eukprot:m.175540 g.175540  ORF g.175540 m.175540 type:complete len:294 (+) comp14615_c0_seq1:125-1006(+)
MSWVWNKDHTVPSWDKTKTPPQHYDQYDCDGNLLLKPSIFYYIMMPVYFALSTVFTLFWWALFRVSAPFYDTIVSPFLLHLQLKLFKLRYYKDHPWYKYNLDLFNEVGVANNVQVVRVAKELVPQLPDVNTALELNPVDFRVAVRVWTKYTNSPLLRFPKPVKKMIRWFALHFNGVYSFFITWMSAVVFRYVVGFSHRVESDQGGYLFIPKCDMLAWAYRYYMDDATDEEERERGRQRAIRICTHVCKIFTEEFMDYSGFPLTIEPNYDTMSCKWRGRRPQMDDPHTTGTLEW